MRERAAESTRPPKRVVFASQACQVDAGRNRCWLATASHGQPVTTSAHPNLGCRASPVSTSPRLAMPSLSGTTAAVPSPAPHCLWRHQPTRPPRCCLCPPLRSRERRTRSYLAIAGSPNKSAPRHSVAQHTKHRPCWLATASPATQCTCLPLHCWLTSARLTI